MISDLPPAIGQESSTEDRRWIPVAQTTRVLLFLSWYRFQKNLIKVLAMSLVAASTFSVASFGHAAPVLIAEGVATQGISQADIAAMVEEARVFALKGKYAEAVLIWEKLLAIAEKLLGPDHPVVANSLYNLASNLREQGQYTAAESMLRRSLAILEKAQGPDHPDVASTLNNLADIMKDQGRYAAAEPLYRRSLAIFEKALGPDHISVATSINNLALIISKQGKYAVAEPLYRRSLGITEKTLGTDHPHVATGLSNLATLLNAQGQLTTAETYLRRSLEIYEKVYGADHPDVATSLRILATILKNQGKYDASEPLIRRSLAILEKTFGTDSLDVALSLNNLADFLSVQGKYSAAEPLLWRSLAINQKLLGPDHPDVATSLYDLGRLLMEQGKYASAEPLLRRSLAIKQKSLRPDHPDVADSLYNLALLLMNQGQYASAEPLLRNSLAIEEKARGPNHPEVATILGTLAVLLSKQGKYAEAEPIHRRSLAIDELVHGKDHPSVASSLNNLAILFGDLGQYAAAEPLIRRSLEINEKIFGFDHPNVAIILNNLATLLIGQSQYAAAEPLLSRALEIKDESLGPDHPSVASTLSNLADVLITNEQFDSAISALNRSLAIKSAWLLSELPFLPDQARSAQLRKLGDDWQWPFGWIDRHSSAANLALETRLNRQGLLPEIEKRQALLLTAQGVERAKVEQVQFLTQQLASVSLPPERRTAVREQRDKLQAEIYRQIPDLQIQLVTAAQVAKSLPADGVLVEFQRFQPYNGRKPINQRWGGAQYIALVLKPDGSINAVPLGAASEVDAQVHKGLNALAKDWSDAEAILAQLSTQILQPLLPHLKDSRQWFFSPDGELNRVPFAALPSPQQPTTPLGQAVQLRLLTTGRELLRLNQPSASSGKNVVMANPSYDHPSAALTAPVDTSLSMGQRRSAEVGTKRWEPLSGSEREGLQVAQLLNSQLISGTTATTTSLRRQQGPRVLHVATHGFFVADQESPPNDPLRVLQEENSQLEGLRQEDPQLRSGLVLAGANQPTMDPNDDGYLTAAEAVTINLKGTELVVLSACSTGQGEVRTGEGVYGLQRSLTVAGARSTLLSLWKVDDAATAAFMTSFYKRLKAGEGRSDALAAVQKEFKEGPIPAWQHPYYWAAWQLVGDWRPIKDL